MSLRNAMTPRCGRPRKARSDLADDPTVIILQTGDAEFLKALRISSRSLTTHRDGLFDRARNALVFESGIRAS